MDPYEEEYQGSSRVPGDSPPPGISEQAAGISQQASYQAPGGTPVEMFDPGSLPPPPAPRLPGAGTALLAFVVFVAAQIVGGMVVGVVAGVQAATSGVDVQDQDAFMEYLQPIIMEYMAYGMVPIMVFSGLAVLVLTRRMAGDAMRVGEADGVGWTTCSPAQFLIGLVMGVGVAVGYIVLAATVFADYQPTSQGDLARMATSGGIVAVLWGVVAVLCAPLIEEFLFRGVMLAGFTRSFGLPLAVVICTTLFVALHIPELVHYWPGTIGVGGMAIVAIGLRIQMKSLGPAIAVHLGYNGVLVALMALSYMSDTLLE
jgi:membrane protease YdiL (CAAX protease family)